MGHSVKFQMLIWLTVSAWSANGIRVYYGANTGPIVPPTPEPPQPPPQQPYKAPAPVWESVKDDTPDPNANWRPQLFVPHPKYTQVDYDPSPTPETLSNAQRFVKSYLPLPPANSGPVQAQSVQNYLSPRDIVPQLGSMNVPGYGLRYFIQLLPGQAEKKEETRKQEDAKHNEIETNDVSGNNADSSSDLQWKHEKEFRKRTAGTSQENTAKPYVYQWPVYVPRKQQ